MNTCILFQFRVYRFAVVKASGGGWKEVEAGL